MAAVERINGRFAPGQSGNPGGKNKDPERFKARLLARAHATDCIDRLADILKNGENRDSIQAAKILLERGFGKPRIADEETNEGKTPGQALLELCAVRGD